MWTQANSRASAPETLGRCRNCPIGAMHAGAEDPATHPLRGSEACCRCHRPDLRLIGDYVCVSCQNREYEWVKGRNAKGRPPAKHPPLVRRRVVTCVGGKVRVMERQRTASSMELVVQALRQSNDRVLFGLGKGRVYGAAV